MIEVGALTSGVAVPSARFRVRQYLPHLLEHGIHVEEFCPSIDKYADLPGIAGRLKVRRWLPPVYAFWMAIRLMARVPGLVKSYGKQVVWLEREFQPGLPTLERFVKRPFVFDVDDAIWKKPPFGKSLAVATARRAHTVIAGNDYIADWCSAYATNIEVVPTAVDVARYCPAKRDTSGEPHKFVIGWMGTSSGFAYLEAISRPLAQFLARHVDAELWIVADRPPRLQGIPAGRLRFIPWSRDIEVSSMQQFEVGIMPLLDDEWSCGKCAFKMLQYMAVAAPVVVSPVGANRQVIQKLNQACCAPRTGDEWIDALEVLYREPDTRQRWGAVGRQTVEREYSAAKIAARLADIIQRVKADA